VQPVEHQFTSPRKCVQQKWSSTGETAAVAVGSAFSTFGSGKRLPTPLAVDDLLLLPEQEVHAFGINWFLDQDIPSHPKGGYVRILPESLLWKENLGKTRMRSTEGLTTCMEPHRG